MKRTSNVLDHLDELVDDDQELQAMIAEEKNNLRVAELIYEMRTAAKLTQAQLAEMIASKQSVIARLESSDYKGHSLTMLNRIATALRYRLVIDLHEADAESSVALIA